MKPKTIRPGKTKININSLKGNCEKFQGICNNKMNGFACFFVTSFNVSQLTLIVIGRLKQVIALFAACTVMITNKQIIYPDRISGDKSVKNIVVSYCPWNKQHYHGKNKN